MTLDSIEDAIRDIKNGKMVVVVDDEDRENEGDLIFAAEKASPDLVNFMVREGRGLICTPIKRELAEKLRLPLMVADHQDPHQTAFTVSIDSKFAGTGISAHDRCTTIRELIRNDVKPEDFHRPGHIFPLIASPGGLEERQGHTEASIELCELANLKPVAVICEILDADGSMARGEALVAFAKKHDLKLVSIKDLIAFKKKAKSSVIQSVESVELPTEYGSFSIHHFEIYGKEHVVLTYGQPMNDTLVRIHSECLTGDVFSSLRCDCGSQLKRSLKMIAENGSGIVVYLKQEGRGIGLKEKIKAYQLQDQGFDTYQANHELGFSHDLREYRAASEVLKYFGVEDIRLISNNPEKRKSIESFGIKVNERINLEPKFQEHNINYLMAKKRLKGHQFNGKNLQ